MIQETEEFIEVQKKLLQAKKEYYIDDAATMSDYDYDMLERKSMKMAKELGFKAERFEDPDDNEKHHVHWMVGYSEDSIYNN